ncbi:MAG: hypothetical protein IKX65_09430 [Prevotella sp.]|nr:hypothetical protein [Prevotella sp.]
MRKVIVFFSLLLMATMSIASVQKSGEEIPLQVGILDPTIPHEPIGRGPVVVPSISLEDYTLFFNTPCDGCTLRLLGANDNVVYSTVIATGTTSLVLPSTLSGEYEIQIIQGNICFYGTIYL